MTLQEWIERSGEVFTRARTAESRLMALGLKAKDEAEANYFFSRAQRVMRLALEMIESFTPQRMTVLR